MTELIRFVWADEKWHTQLRRALGSELEFCFWISTIMVGKFPNSQNYHKIHFQWAPTGWDNRIIRMPFTPICIHLIFRHASHGTSPLPSAPKWRELRATVPMVLGYLADGTIFFAFSTLSRGTFISNFCGLKIDLCICHEFRGFFLNYIFLMFQIKFSCFFSVYIKFYQNFKKIKS